MNILNSILLQAASTGDAAQGVLGQYGGLIMIVLMILIFYFFMIRPQSKRQKEIRKQREAMREGDRVVTAGGIYGKIKKVNDRTFDLEVAPNVTIRVEKTSVYPSAEDAAQATNENK